MSRDFCLNSERDLLRQSISQINQVHQQRSNQYSPALEPREPFGNLRLILKLGHLFTNDRKKNCIPRIRPTAAFRTDNPKRCNSWLSTSKPLNRPSYESHLVPSRVRLGVKYRCNSPATIHCREKIAQQKAGQQQIQARVKLMQVAAACPANSRICLSKTRHKTASGDAIAP